MNEPGSFKRVFELRPFLRMVGGAGIVAWLLLKALWVALAPHIASMGLPKLI